ncbi:MAG: class I SAM-dependent methyltransferase [Candidatus Heimdallarchaeaceae archaeon]
MKKGKKDIFSKIAPKYDHLIGAFEYKKLKEYLPLNQNEVLLDIGGGTGRATEELTEQVKCCILLDLSFEMLQQSQSKSRKIFQVQGLAEHLPFKEEAISQIFINDTFHHIQKQQETLSECYKVAKKGCRLIIREYDRAYFWNFLLILFEKILRFNSKFKTPKELKEMCEKEKFMVNEVHKPNKSTYIIISVK